MHCEYDQYYVDANTWTLSVREFLDPTPPAWIPSIGLLCLLPEHSDTRDAYRWLFYATDTDTTERYRYSIDIVIPTVWAQV